MADERLERLAREYNQRYRDDGPEAAASWLHQNTVRYNHQEVAAAVERNRGKYARRGNKQR